MRGTAIVVTLGLALAGCTNTNFQCSDDSTCVLDGQDGTCEADGFCAFPDPGCDSGRRYGEFGENPYAGQCVGVEPTDGTTANGSSTSSGPQTTLPPPSGTSTASSTTTPETTTSTSSSTGDSSTSTSTSSSSGESSSDSGFIEPEYNLAFLAGTPTLPGEMGGLAGADAICGAAARQAGLPGNYVAVLSDETTQAVDRLEGARGWIRLDGLPVADRPIDLLQGRMWHPVNIDETGQTLIGSLIITGTYGSGAYDTRSNCQDWTSTSVDDLYRRGRSGRTYDDWLSSGASSCDSNGHIYCFGTDLDVQLEVESTQGRIAFVSQASMPADAGIDAFDATCQTEADAAGFGGTFLAFIGTTTASPLSRFTTDGATWVNTAGFPIVPTAATLSISADIVAPVGFTAEGQPTLAAAWTGARSPVESTNFNCENWTVSTEGGATVAVAGGTESWLDTEFVGCTADRSVFCFQE